MYDRTSNNPNAFWNQFRNAFNEVADIHAHMKILRVRSAYAPWLNENIKKEMNYCDLL